MASNSRQTAMACAQNSPEVRGFERLKRLPAETAISLMKVGFEMRQGKGGPTR